MDDYNYDQFKTDLYTLSSMEGPQVGERYIDGQLFDLDGNPVQLSSLLDQPLVLETGSITCGLYRMGLDKMNQLMEDYPDVKFVVMYVREAHPGSKRGSHQSLDDKLNLACKMKEEFPENRMVLVDDIDGNVHRKYSALPNLVYIIDTDGIVRYKAIWNNPKSVAKILDQLDNGQITEYPPPQFLPPLYRMSLNFKTLYRAGWDAIFDFLPALPKLLWSRIKLRKNWNEEDILDKSIINSDSNG